MVDICDLDLIGSKLEQGDLVIDLTREYYQQQVIEQPYAQDLLHKCDIANLVGERIVKQAGCGSGQPDSRPAQRQAVRTS